MENALFKKVNFVGSYYDKEMAFYSRYFQNEDEELKFFEEVFKNDEIDCVPRLMMNITERWVSFADDLEKNTSTVRCAKNSLL
jgi:hypothetical protein